MTNILFSQQDVELLKNHLQALIQVEFFTVPLYLTATTKFPRGRLNGLLTGFSNDGLGLAQAAEKSPLKRARGTGDHAN